MVAAVSSHHVFIHRELDLSPELTVLLRAHGQPEKNSYKHQKATEILSERKGELAAVNKTVKALELKKKKFLTAQSLRKCLVIRITK